MILAVAAVMAAIAAGIGYAVRDFQCFEAHGRSRKSSRFPSRCVKCGIPFDDGHDRWRFIESKNELVRLCRCGFLARTPPLDTAAPQGAVSEPQ